MTAELLDVVNEQDEVIGQRYREEIYAQKIFAFRVVNGFLINDARQVWIPRRSASKKLFPLCLDTSIGGHVMAGESYESAFARETQEELAIDIHNLPYSFLGKLTPQSHNVSAFMHVYAIYTNIDPDYNRSDFVEAYWKTPAEVIESIKNGEQAKGDLPALLAFVQNCLSNNCGKKLSLGRTKA